MERFDVSLKKALQAETCCRKNKAEMLHSVCILLLLAIHSLRMCTVGVQRYVCNV